MSKDRTKIGKNRREDARHQSVLQVQDWLGELVKSWWGPGAATTAGLLTLVSHQMSSLDACPWWLVGVYFIGWTALVVAAAHVAVVRYTRKVSEDKQTLVDTQDEAEQAARTEGHAAGRTELIAEQALETPPILLACLQAVARDQENVDNYIRVGVRVVEALNGRNYDAFRQVVRAFREDGVVIQNAGLADFWRRNLEAYQLEVL